MSEFEITIKNYRCFSDEMPAQLIIKDGFTALVGVNNSGKSSLLRFFYEIRHYFPNLLNNILKCINNNVNFNPMSPMKDKDQIFYNGTNRDLVFEIKSNEKGQIENLSFYPFTMRAILYRNSKQWRLEFNSKNGIPPRNEMGLVDNADYITLSVKKAFYIKPVTELFKGLYNSLYVGAFRNALNIGSLENYYDIEVGQAFIKKWRQIKTGNSAKDNEAAFQLTEDIKHIFNFEQLEINPSDDDQTLQIFINGRSYKLFDVGSGLAQFILVLVNAAIKKPAYIFIDEPELNLHPSLQLDFLTTLGAYAQRGVFFATHNIGLARAVGDQIYAVRKTNDNYSEVKPLESISRLSEFLGELSFSGYREIGFSTVLLVEGSTEVKTIQQFLRKIKKDHEVVMVPLGGSQLINPDREIELAELTRIPAKFYALIDSEKDSQDTPLSEKRQDFVNICEQLGIQCKVLERRATENYLTEHSIKDVLGQKYRALDPYESVTKIEMGWSKSDNWRIARRMDFEDIENTDLGMFLKSL